MDNNAENATTQAESPELVAAVVEMLKAKLRLYKVWTCTVNNVTTWQGCPRHMVGEFAKHLRDQMRVETDTTA